MQTLEIQAFANAASLMLPDTVKRRLILPCLVGMALGNFLQVKLGEDMNPMTSFADMHAGNVSHAVSCLNEEMFLDVPATIDAAKMMYMLRHRILNAQPCDYQTNPEFDFMAVALGLSVVLPLEVFNAIKETGLSSSKVYSAANLMISKLKASNKLYAL